MKKTIKLLALGLLFPIIAHAQESVGFSETDNIQPLLDYRLPAWGYSNIFFDFSLSGDFSSQDQNNASSPSNHSFSTHLSPVYTRFRESETRVSTFRLVPYIEYGYSDNTSSSGVERSRHATSLRNSWRIDEKLYLGDSDIYFIGFSNGQFRQDNTWLESMENDIQSNESLVNRYLFTTLAIGVGYGRLRNMNPVIRALRLNERLQALGTDHQMQQNDILRAAEHFTALQGYQQTYDRPDKHFWGDMDQQITANLGALDVFDMLYLMDVQRETLGLRQEGWQIQATAGLQHLVNYSDNEITGSLNRSTFFFPQMNGIWSKNISLKHQLSLRGNLQYLRTLDNNSSISPNATNFTSTAGWLYTVTDRFLVTTSITYVRNWRQDFPAGNIFAVNSDFSYFLENRISLFADAGFTYTSASFSSKNLQFNAGVRYYLRRQLF